MMLFSFIILVITTLISLYFHMKNRYSDGFPLFLCTIGWILLGTSYILHADVENYIVLDDYVTQSVEEGIHVMHEGDSEFINDVYLVNNIQDTSKVRIVRYVWYNPFGWEMENNLKVMPNEEFKENVKDGYNVLQNNN